MLSPDSIIPDPMNPQSYNRYSYVLNNPINLTDPSGHNPICNHDGSICSDGAFDDGQSELKYGISTTMAVVNSWDILGMLHDPTRTEPLVTDIIINNEIVGQYYAMPVGAQQSYADTDSLKYKVGRMLSGAGIASDILELILTPVGGGAALGVGDGAITFASGALTGDNYGIFYQHPDLPMMLVSANQDSFVNIGEALIGGGAELAFSGLGALTGNPAGAIGGFALGSFVDAVTSASSGIYDYGRYKGDLSNYMSAGISQEGDLTVVYWPQPQGGN